MTDFVGTTGDDSFLGGAAADRFDMSQGGDDTVQGGAGQDVFGFGASFTNGDRIDGGAGHDTLMLRGDYSLTLGAASLQSVEAIKLSGGQYDLTLADAIVPAGGILRIHAQGPARIDASADTDGRLFVWGTGKDSFTGGAGDDIFVLSKELTAHDHFDGGSGGIDSLRLYGGGGTLTVGAGVIADIDAILITGDAHWLLRDGAVAPGGELEIQSYFGGTLDIDAHAERDGSFDFEGGNSDDHLVGGWLSDELNGHGGADTLVGGRGLDSLVGGDGADTFAYSSIRDSTPQAADLIYDLEDQDHIDLSAIDADRTTAGDQAFRVVAAFDHQAGELTIVYDTAATATYLSGDVDGDGQADFFVRLLHDHRDFPGLVL